MAAPSLLDEMTQILAYIGDEEAQDGYYIGKNSYGNPKYSVEIRGEPLSKSEIAEFYKKMIQIFVKFRRDILSSIEPDDVKTKVNNLYGMNYGII